MKVPFKTPRQFYDIAKRSIIYVIKEVQLNDYHKLIKGFTSNHFHLSSGSLGSTGSG